MSGSLRKKQLESIKQKGGQIADDPGAVKQKSSIKWRVRSQSHKKLWYTVILCAAGLVCSCPGCANGVMICKHVMAINRARFRSCRKTMQYIRIERQATRCRHCKSDDFIKYGRRKCRHKSVQRYLCKSCKRTFSGIDGFVGRHFAPKVIVTALSLVAGGMSCVGARQQLATLEIAIHQDTIAAWVDSYSDMMDRYSGMLRISAGFRWHVDELGFKIRAQQRWLFAVMDGQSRFVLSYQISPVKLSFDPLSLFASAAGRVVRLPQILVSDGLKVFIPAARTVFYRRGGPRFVHVREIHLQNMFNNNICERLNGEFEDRLARIRGLKTELPAVVRLMIVHHNFFRRHKGLGGRTPAMAAGIDIAFEKDAEPVGPDAWITLIQNAAISRAA